MSTDRDARSVFEAYLRAANGRDVRPSRVCSTTNFEDVYPQSGELTRGLANFRSIIEQYPGGGYAGQGTDRLVGTAAPPCCVVYGRASHLTEPRTIRPRPAPLSTCNEG